uniref:Uncharacterized protein n=1 Tax=Fagus sylvatica TaxID=28930 RepID=A0A2N9IDH5_FAGSY
MPWPWQALAAHGIALAVACLGSLVASLALAAMALPWHNMPWLWHALAVACLGRGMPWKPWHCLGITCLGCGMPWQHMPWQHMPWSPGMPWQHHGTCLGLGSSHGIALASHALAWPAHALALPRQALPPKNNPKSRKEASLAWPWQPMPTACMLPAAHGGEACLTYATNKRAALMPPPPHMHATGKLACVEGMGGQCDGHHHHHHRRCGADLALLDASSCLSSLDAWHAVVRLVVLWSSVRDGMTMKSSMCPTAASLRCVVVVDHVGVLVLSVAEHNVERSAPGVHRSARPFYRRCAPGLNWPGRASGAVTLKKLECSKQAYALDTLAWDNIIGFRRTTAKAFAKDVFINQERKLGARRRSDTVLVSTINDADQGLADVTYRTPPAPYEKSKSLGSGGSMVARLKLKGIDGRAPPGVEPAA